MRNLSNLTPGERRVADLLLEGLSRKEIEYRLGKAHDTIHAQLHSIFRKLGAKNRTHAVVILYRRKIAEANEGWTIWT